MIQGLLGESSAAEVGVHTSDDFAAFFKSKVDAVPASTAAMPVYAVPHGATAKTLVHAFVTSRVDYCNVDFAGAPKSTTKLQRVLNDAARVICCTRKFDRCLMRLLHDKLHWLDVPEQVSATAARQHLHSAASHTEAARAVAGLVAWNSLPKRLHDFSLSCFGCFLKTLIFSDYWRMQVYSALEALRMMCYINLRFYIT